MHIDMSRKLTLTMYCLARQAERSIDFALSSAAQWDLLRAYYDDDRLSQLVELKGVLTQAHPGHPQNYVKEKFGEITVGWVAAYPFRSWLNRWRTNWEFAAGEVSFFIDTLSRVVSALRCEAQPPPSSLVALRIDLHLCQRIIERKLVGVPLLKKAATIEHFCQAEHLDSVSLSEVVGLFGESRVA